MFFFLCSEFLVELLYYSVKEDDEYPPLISSTTNLRIKEIKIPPAITEEFDDTIQNESENEFSIDKLMSPTEIKKHLRKLKKKMRRVKNKIKTLKGGGKSRTKKPKKKSTRPKLRRNVYLYSYQ